MELKIIPAPLYKDNNGIPAYKSGEWPGIKSNHFDRTRLMLRLIRKNPNYERKLSYRHIEEKPSKEYIFRPSLKLVKSYLENLKNQRQIIQGRNHDIDFSKITSDTYDNNLFFGHKRYKNSILANSLILPKIKENKLKKRQINMIHSLSEINVERAMNRKKRINSLEQQRNFFKINNQGDKNYRYADCSENFFKEGGLIPGSTNKIRISENYNKIKNNIYEYMNLNVKSLDVDKIWDNKIKRERQEDEKQYVLNLENWDNMNIKFNENKNMKEKSDENPKKKQKK